MLAGAVVWVAAVCWLAGSDQRGGDRSLCVSGLQWLPGTFKSVLEQQGKSLVDGHTCIFFGRKCTLMPHNFCILNTDIVSVVRLACTCKLKSGSVCPSFEKMYVLIISEIPLLLVLWSIKNGKFFNIQLLLVEWNYFQFEKLDQQAEGLATASLCTRILRPQVTEAKCGVICQSCWSCTIQTHIEKPTYLMQVWNLNSHLIITLLYPYFNFYFFAWDCLVWKCWREKWHVEWSYSWYAQLSP